jgi:hypothetical protein
MNDTLKIIGFALAAGAAAMPAAAAPSISEVLTITSTIRHFSPYTPGAGELTTLPDVSNEDFSFSSGNRSTGVQLTSFVQPTGNFFFLHNIYAQGDGFAELETKLQIAITNSGASTAFLRLDSLITPGFIGIQGHNSSNTTGVQFSFTVEQFDGGPTSGNRTDLYSARGAIGSLAPYIDGEIETSDGRSFNGFSSYDEYNRTAYEWGATPLSLALAPIAAGETHYIQYMNYTRVDVRGGLCTTVLGCHGVQVAFGDPRNDGGTDPFRVAGGGVSSFLAPVSNDQILIGRRFNATTYSMADVVDTSAPLPDPDLLPPPAPPSNFAWLPPVNSVTGGVPEPASWLMLITGFGLVGTMLRRRQPVRTA